MQIPFERHTLRNGLTVIAHRDPLTPMVCVNVMYQVGSRNEDPCRTGFAHLFEHLMFGGSKNIPQYDHHVDLVGGENNAFTNSDITNFYLSVPASALETVFWLESDRMLELAFSEETLSIQKAVVVEEFKQRYLNQPYGDIWLLLRPLAYTVHPYRWPAIGMDPSHIEAASLDDVKAFFGKHYHPANAVLSVAGNVDPDLVFRRAEHWFGGIPGRVRADREWPQEPVQTTKRQKEVSRDVPVHAWYQAYHMPSRNSDGYHAIDLLTDILSGGFSSRFYQRLIQDSALFSDLSAFVTGDLDPGLLVISGKISEGIPIEKAIQAGEDELSKIMEGDIPERELEKVKNKAESMLLFSARNLSERAMNLAYYEIMGDAGEINRQIDRYRSVTREDLREQANNIFREHNASSLYYKASGVL